MRAPTYCGEAMLLRWADSSTNGRTVTFVIEDSLDATIAHPFKGLPCGKDGQRFALVVVPVGEDEHPDFQTDKPGPSKSAAPEKGRRRLHELPRSQQAALMCDRQDFQHWLRAHDSKHAAVVVREWCKVKSRAEFDSDNSAALRWDGLLLDFRSETQQMAEQRG